MGFQCEKLYTIPVPTYEFTEKLSLTPYKKIYAINDTIWVQFQTTNKTLFDKLSGNRVATDTSFLQVGFSLNRLFPLGNTVELFSDVKVENGLNILFKPLSQSNNDLTFKTACSDNRYFFRIGIIPKKIGVYIVAARSDVSPCPTQINQPYSTFKFTFDLADCNKDIFLSIPPESRGGQLGYTDVSIDKKELFAFKVE